MSKQLVIREIPPRPRKFVVYIVEEVVGQCGPEERRYKERAFPSEEEAQAYADRLLKPASSKVIETRVNIPE